MEDLKKYQKKTTKYKHELMSLNELSGRPVVRGVGIELYGRVDLKSRFVIEVHLECATLSPALIGQCGLCAQNILKLCELLGTGNVSERYLA
eukprot:1338527-Amorphochlora_amoeboformis.AAC.1